MVMFGLYHFKLLILVSLFTFGSLSGCSGGGGGDGGVEGDSVAANTNDPGNSVNTPPVVTLPANDSPGGVWIGTVTSTQTGESFESIGLVTEAGQMRLITKDRDQIAGNISVTDKSFTGDIISYAPFEFLVYAKGEPIVTGTASGTVNERSTFSGSTTLNGAITANFNFTYDAAIYQKDSSLALISGNYSASDDEGYVVTYSINTAGIITGSDTDGCLMNGDVELLDTNYNMYRLKIVVTNCGELNGNFRGPASLFDVDSSNDTLVFSLECVRFLIAGAILRT